MSVSTEFPTAEVPITFACEQDLLFGIIHRPKQLFTRGVLIIVGGPQYRVGSHRQFILLARHLASNSVPTMRFDYRGMGDSAGEQRSFDNIDGDIRKAIDKFFEDCPELTEVVLWGLCDAASAALFYGYQDARVIGMVLLNPWVFTEEGAAKTYLKHYYLRRILSRDMWRKILRLEFDYRGAAASFLAMLSKGIGKVSGNGSRESSLSTSDADLPLPERMRMGLQRFKFPVLLILSGNDLTAAEFRDTVKSSPQWQALLSSERIAQYDVVAANHTFSTAQWREQVENETLRWVISLS